LEKQPNIFYKALSFLARSNFFIAVCAASATAFSQALFLQKISLVNVWIIFGTTFVLYNVQQLYLGYITLKSIAEKKKWAEKNKVILQLTFLMFVSEIYPVYKSSPQFLFTYVVAGIISLLYFLPYSNLRSVPFLKSFIVGLVWTLICVVAPLEPSLISRELLAFSLAQLFFITALCILFNIRDTEEDRAAGTFTIPVLYGPRIAKLFALALLLGYLVASLFAEATILFGVFSAFIFLLSCLFTAWSSPKKHSFYYLFGVDGLILIQSIVGILILRV